MVNNNQKQQTIVAGMSAPVPLSINLEMSQIQKELLCQVYVHVNNTNYKLNKPLLACGSGTEKSIIFQSNKYISQKSKETGHLVDIWIKQNMIR